MADGSCFSTEGTQEMQKGKRGGCRDMQPVKGDFFRHNFYVLIFTTAFYDCAWREHKCAPSGRIFIEQRERVFLLKKRRTGSIVWKLPRRERSLQVIGDDGNKIHNGGFMTKDPVCGMNLDENKVEFQTQFAGRSYSFCSENCKNEFEADPDEYVETAAA